MRSIQCAICKLTCSEQGLYDHLVLAHGWMPTLLRNGAIQPKARPGAKKENSARHADQHGKSKNLLVTKTNSVVSSADTKLIDELVSTKGLDYLKKEEVRLHNLLSHPEKTSERCLVAQRYELIVIARAKAERQQKKSKRDKQKRPGGDLMDQYVSGKKVVLSGGLPSLGKRR